jgi:hypothetical protein
VKLLESIRGALTRDLHRERPPRRTESLMEALGISLQHSLLS